MNFGQRWKGLTQKARDFWADLTEDESRKSVSGGEAMHQRFGSDEKHNELARGSDAAERARRDRDENSMDRGPEDAILANPAARAGRQMGGGQQTSSAQQAQQSRQYTQQGGSGLQKTIGQQTRGQMGGQAGSSDLERNEDQLRGRSGPGGRSR